MNKIKQVLPIIIITFLMIGLVRYESKERYIKKEDIAEYVKSIQESK